ncbi:MAG TPA: triose-phosphate isomerase [bacterium]|nr:triose-phosphate isomerase [bacterium]
MVRRKVIAGNWKMHKTPEESTFFVENLLRKSLNTEIVDVILCVPFTSLAQVSEMLENEPVGWGAQNMHWEEAGAFTGEISPTMLQSTGCEFVILGHSERRQYYAETDETVGNKVRSALEHTLKPIVCIGESLDQREAGKVEEILDRQLSGAFAGLKKEQLETVTIAYEPVWAIGTGVNATPDQAVEAHQFIREWLDTSFGDGTGEATTVLYGGSMKPANAESLLEHAAIDGGLIGGASLQADSFSELVSIAAGVS